jgi:hypothetical protein
MAPKKREWIQSLNDSPAIALWTLSDSKEAKN